MSKRERRFELVAGSSAKFWAITVVKATVTVRYGRIGTQGQTKVHELPSSADATAKAEKLVAEKTKKGYVELGGAKATKGAPKKKSAKKKPAKNKPAANKGPSKLRVAFDKALGELPVDLAALLDHAAKAKKSAFFGSPTYGELTLAPKPKGAAHYVDSADGDAWAALFRDVAWIGEEADGGLLGYWRHGTDSLDQVLYLDNEGSLTVTGRDLVDHFAWVVGFDDHPELDAVCEEAGLEAPPSRAVWLERVGKLASPEQRIDELIKAAAKAQGPAGRPVDRWPCCAVLADGRFLVVSSEDDVTRPDSYEANVAFVFDPTLERFARVPDTPFRAYLNAHALAPLKDGRTPFLALSDDVRVGFYDPAADAWTTGAQLHERPHDGGAAVLLRDGRIAVFGGGWSSGGASDCVDVYDPRKDRWTEARALPTPRRDLRAVVLADGRVLTVGGSGSDYADKRACEIWNPKTDRWTTAAKLTKAESSVSLLSLDDGRVLMTRGDERGFYEPAKDKWSNRRREAGIAQALLKLGDGRVACFDQQTVTILDPYKGKAGKATVVGSTALTRNGSTHALELPDGRILLVGGDLYNNIASEPEIWDPHSGEGRALPGFEKPFEKQRKALARRQDK